MTKTTWHIHIQGQVQGVGFRPFIYQLAQKFKLNGWVHNTADGVHIDLNADEEVGMKFYDELISNPPKLSHITSHSINKISPAEYKNFSIIKSSSDESPLLLISPDFAMCEDCCIEISDPTNRRYNYAFTTCTQCGPRYSIISKLPYDRVHTTMQAFNMCTQCEEEYNDPANRRHFSQTNSCPDCAVEMKLYSADKTPMPLTEFENDEDTKENSDVVFQDIKHKLQNIISGIEEYSEGAGEADNELRERFSKKKQLNTSKEIITKICELWKDGKIIAIKGIGGYLLTCDASNVNTVKALRKRKHRPAKPFALMFPGIKHLSAEADLNEPEKKELGSVSAPIVIVKLKENSNSKLALTEIAPNLSKIGAMLPYAPLYHLLMHEFDKPIVATSGNLSNAPIVYEDDIASNELSMIADYILVNNRKIIAPQDDSVVQYSRFYKKRIILRRARGFSPFYLNEQLSLPNETLLATGALLKSSFTLLHKQNVHVSQCLGDTINYDTQKNFENSVDHYLKFFKTQPEVITADKHPGYFTTQLAQQLSAAWNIPIIKVQHHEAHFASVLGENNLLDETEPILGVVWDGTGLGNDGQIWGGDFFTYQRHRFLRTDNFEYFNHILGDKMVREPRLCAFSICSGKEEAADILQPKFSGEEWYNYKQLIKTNELNTSSVGRMFDAAASLLGIIDKITFEGEASNLLEEAAYQYFKNRLEIPQCWLEEYSTENLLSAPHLMLQIVKKINEKKDTPEIAAWFHVQLVLAIQKLAKKNNCQKICFSGGVFQNGLLVDLLLKIMGEQFELYFNKNLSPNDENISFGQLIWFIASKQTALQKKV